MMVRKSEKEMFDISYDVHDMEINEHGVANFFWPSSYASRNRFFVSLVNSYTDKIHENADQEPSYKILSKQFVAESMTIFWAEALREGAMKANRNIFLPERLRIWNAAFTKTGYPEPGFLKNLRNEKAKKSGFRQRLNISFAMKAFQLLKMKGGRVTVNNMLVTRVTPAALKTSIIASQRIPLLSRHASCADKDVIFCRTERWFSPISEEDIQKEKRNANIKFESAIMDEVKRLFTAENVPMPKMASEHLSRVLSDGSAMVRIHQNRLKSPDIEVPQNLWTGTAGYIWDTMLRHEVKNRSGFVAGHDHGAGQGHVDNVMTGFTELWSCDEYFTFNEGQAAELKAHAPNWPKLDGKIPAIRGVPDTGNSRPQLKIYPRFATPNFKVKNIAFMATIFDGDRGRMGPCSPDIVHVDWQARLITALKSWGYNVIIKIHPESAILPPDYFTNELGARVETRKVEDVLEDFDLLLFDSLYTTAISASLQTNIPMHLIDFYNHPWTVKGRTLFSKRCPITDGRFDEDNRKQIDWSALRQDLETAPSKNSNHEFFHHYYA